MNFLRLSSLVRDKESSFRFLQEHGIVHTERERRCRNHHVTSLSLTDIEDRWRCPQSQYKEDVFVRRGTWLERSRLTYRQIIMFIYCWAKEMTMQFCDRELKFNELSAPGSLLRKETKDRMGHTDPCWTLTCASSCGGIGSKFAY